MKICHVFNMANNAYHICLALRKHDIDVDLILNSKTFGMGLPMWEDLDYYSDPYDFDIKEALKRFDLPDWMKIWWTGKRIVPHSVAELFRMIKPYDLLHLHPYSPMYLQFAGKPYIIHEAGWIRRLATRDTIPEKFGRRAYVKADCVVWTNPDTIPLLEALHCKRLEYIPFVIDPERYKPMKVEKGDDLLFFHPARQVWDVKGNDKLIRAFGLFIKNGYVARLRCVDWGYEDDVRKAKDLVKTLKISEYVEWVSPYPKPQLIRAYNEADAVFDQFTIGGSGTVGLEAMSCGTPLVIYMLHWTEKAFGEWPPVVNAHTALDIYEKMLLLTDPSYRKKIGEAGRQFIIKHCHPDVIAKKLINLYEEILQ